MQRIFTAWGMVAVAIFAWTQARVADAAVQSSCPAPDDDARTRVVRLLTDPDLAEFRTRYGISNVSASDLRALSDSVDASTCDRLNEIAMLENYGLEVYFASGSFFFATAVFNAPPDTISLVQIPVAVIDSAFTPRGAIGM